MYGQSWQNTRPPANWHPVPGHGCDHMFLTSQPNVHFIPPLYCSLMLLSYFCYSWAFVKPGTGRRLVDWCRKWMSVLYKLTPTSIWYDCVCLNGNLNHKGAAGAWQTLARRASSMLTSYYHRLHNPILDSKCAPHDFGAAENVEWNSVVQGVSKNTPPFLNYF